MIVQSVSPRFVHPMALCESDRIGEGTRIWAFAHVMDGAVIGAHCNLGGQVFVERGAHIGDGVVIKNGVMVWDGVTIEDYAFIGPGVVFTNDRYPRSRHLPEARERYAVCEQWREPTWVKRGASIGAQATILCGLTIGENAMVAAGSLVTRSVASHRLVAGSPARPVGWVCLCGQRLGEWLACGACARRYRLEKQVLSLEK
jgi:UDP-2-acetamido-3-amino-2,3-dideoxy-glucuronate N-acetyltransferase